MKLNDEQIQTLFDFTQKKLVPYYDLQIELVDHLAANIEERMDQNKKLTFEKALQEVYKGFGIFGFSQIVREKQNQLTKKYKKLLWKEIVALFQWPQIVRMFALFALLFTLSNTVNLLYLRIAFVLIAISFLIYSLVQLRKNQKPKKQLLLMQYFQPGAGAAWSYLYFQFLFNYQDRFLPVTGDYEPLLFTLMNFALIIVLFASWQLNTKIKEQAIELYPEAFELTDA